MQVYLFVYSLYTINNTQNYDEKLKKKKKKRRSKNN